MPRAHYALTFRVCPGSLPVELWKEVLDVAAGPGYYGGGVTLEGLGLLIRVCLPFVKSCRDQPANKLLHRKQLSAGLMLYVHIHATTFDQLCTGSDAAPLITSAVAGIHSVSQAVQRCCRPFQNKGP